MDELLPPEIPTPEHDSPQPGFVGRETLQVRVLDFVRAHSNHLIGAGIFLFGNLTGYLAGRPHKQTAPSKALQASVFPATAPKSAASKPAQSAAAPAKKTALSKPSYAPNKSAKAAAAKPAKKPAAKPAPSKKASKSK